MRGRGFRILRNIFEEAQILSWQSEKSFLLKKSNDLRPRINESF